MRPVTITTVLFAAVLLLTACTPIPAPRTEVKAGPSDLASAFAKIDEAPSTEPYEAVIQELLICTARDSELSPAENLMGAAFTIGFTAGMSLTSPGNKSAYAMIENALKVCLDQQ